MAWLGPHILELFQRPCHPCLVGVAGPTVVGVAIIKAEKCTQIDITCTVLINVTEFWKINQFTVHETIRIFIFNLVLP